MKLDKIIALDLDGVIWDLVNPWIKVYNKLYSDNLNFNDIQEYDLRLYMTNATESQILKILENRYFWNLVEPFEYSYEYLNKLNSEYNLYIATKTDYKIFEIKIDRLLTLFPFLKRNQIICIHNKSLLNVDWLVDDCVDNLKLGLFNKILLDAPYNRGNNDFIRANNLKDVYEIITDWSMSNGRSIFN